ncbi:MAG: hypothetical protein LUE16_09320 [Lachnospiraceae bacterium]|nr:hypothetical protein [Lachnospiraceae bacterium]
MAVNHAGGEHVWKWLTDEELLKSAGLYGTDMVTGESGYNLAAIMLLGKDDVIRIVVPLDGAYSFDYNLGKSVPVQRNKEGNPEQSGSSDLTDQEQTIIEYIRKEGSCTTIKIAGLLDVTDRRARTVLGSLVKKNILKKSGNARSTMYVMGTEFPVE